MQLMDSEEFEAFEAVLALIDEYSDEVPSDSSEGGVHDISALPLETTPSSPLKRPQRRSIKSTNRTKPAPTDAPEIARIKAKLAVPGRNRSRDLQKLELLQLRVEAAALEERLDYLHSAGGMNSTVAVGTRRPADELLLNACESLAKKQKTLRKQAERENGMLRQLVESRRRTIKTLKRLFQKQSLDKAPLSLAWRVNPPFRDDDTHDTLQQLTSTLGTLCGETDHVLMSNRLNTVNSPFFQLNSRTISATSAHIEILKCEVLPFHYRAVGSAFMDKMASQFDEDESNPDAFEDNLATRAFSVDVGDRMKVLFRYSSAKFSEPGRDVIVLSGRNKIEEVLGASLDDAHYHERSWCVLNDVSPGVCLLQMYIGITIEAGSVVRDTGEQLFLQLSRLVSDLRQKMLKAVLKDVEQKLLLAERSIEH